MNIFDILLKDLIGFNLFYFYIIIEYSVYFIVIFYFVDLLIYIGNVINILMSVIVKGYLIMLKDELRECKWIVLNN